MTDDPNGTIGITLAGYNSSNQGVIEHYEVTGSRGARVNEAGAWPMFHHDPQLTGNAGTAHPVVAGPLQRAVAAPRVRHDGLGRRRVQLREPPLLRFDRQPPPHQARGGHVGHP